MKSTRRSFCKLVGGAATVGALGFPYIARASNTRRKAIVLAADGMDPRLLRSFMQSGGMPNCRRLIQQGSLHPMRTTTPPQSPVAWSSFISGADPGGHGVFDFIARDSADLSPYLATARTFPPERVLKLGKYRLPLDRGETVLLREGATLWDVLQQGGIDSTVFKAPVNFPPTETDARTLSGITTPDIHGSYGMFTFYTSDPSALSRDVPGGRIERIRLRDGRAECELQGPENTFRADTDSARVSLTAEVDPRHASARIRLQDQSLILRVGEWSDWVTVRFSMIRWIAETQGACRLYLKQVSPHLELYVSPVNIHPADPSVPISTPDGYARELAEEVGLFYTQGMPEDTAALSAKVLNDDEFRMLSTFIIEERMKFLEYELNRFNDGFLFFYFSSLDLNSHAFWRTIDTRHPLYDLATAERHGDFLRELYGRIDDALGKVLSVADEDTAVWLISDHGFGSFRRQFHLNSWLMDNGYAAARNPMERGYASYFQDVDWTRTRAYGLGINGLYLNLKGREPDGQVEPEQADGLRDELTARLTGLIDEETGERVVRGVYRPEAIYHGSCLDRAPDLVVGYNEHHRASWDTILGKYPREHLADNNDPWSGDHCMDADCLPGVCLSNRPLKTDQPSLRDMAPTLLDAFNLPIPDTMTGRII